MKLLKIFNLSFLFLICISVLLVFGCKPNSDISSSTNIASDPVGNNVVSNLAVPDKKENSNIVVPPPKIFGSLTSNPEELNAKFAPTGGVKGDTYEAMYSAKTTGKDEVKIVITTTEGEVLGIQITILPISKMIFLRKDQNNSGKIILLPKKSELTHNPKAQKCFASAQKLLGNYETNLKVSESSVKKFWLEGCSSLPQSWLVPVNDEVLEEEYDNSEKA